MSALDLCKTHLGESKGIPNQIRNTKETQKMSVSEIHLSDFTGKGTAMMQGTIAWISRITALNRPI